MALLLYSVIRRHMKHTGRYFEGNGHAEAPVIPEMLPGESVIGWYRNPEPWDRCALVFTDMAIYSMEDRQVVRLPLADIVGYELPKSKTDVTGVRVRTRDGFRFLRAAGSYGEAGHFKDAFGLVQVIRALAARNTP